jgi:hypothetical protein
VVSIPQLLRRASDIQPPETVQKDYTNEETSPGPDGVNYAICLKATKAERFKKKWGGEPLVFKPSRLLAKGKLMSLAKVFYLNKGNITVNGV